jgi:hypothetical protein
MYGLWIINLFSTVVACVNVYTAILKLINVGTTLAAVGERLQKLKSPNGLITDRTMEVATAAAVSSILTLALVVASSIGAEIFRDNGITITSLWSLWTTVLALDSNWYYFMRLKSVENSIRLSHFQMINCCKHDFLYALSAGSLEDVFMIVNESN